MNPSAQEAVKKFYNAAYSVSTLKPIQSAKTDSKVIVPEQNLQLHRSDSAPATLETAKRLNIQQVYKVEGGDHTFRNLLLFFILAMSIIFAVDLYKEMHQERVQLEIRRKKCYQEYNENECQNPVEAIRQLCHELQVCFKKDPQMTIRTTQVVAKLIGRLVEAFLRETTVWGAIFLLIFVGLLLVIICRYSKRSQIQETRFKND